MFLAGPRRIALSLSAMEFNTSQPLESSGHEPFFIVLNTASGRDNAPVEQARIRAVLDQAGRSYTLMPAGSGAELMRLARQAVTLAREQGGVVVAAGGDGTLNAVAREVLGAGVLFGVLPQGTFNYFGRDYGISQDTQTAVQSLLDARVQTVQVGLLNGQMFLVNASLGLYPTLLEDREAYKQRYGRSRWVALWSSLVTLARAHRRFAVQLEHEGRQQILRTSTILVGNNALQLEQVGIAEVSELSRRQLVAIVAKPAGAWSLYGLLLRGMLSRLGEADQVLSFGTRHLLLRFGRRRRRIKVAMDGEVSWLQAPLEFKVAEQGLPLLVPRHPEHYHRA